MISIKENRHLISCILLYYTFCIFSHTIISSAHFIEHLIEHDHYHLDEFHGSLHDQPYQGHNHEHSFLIDTFLFVKNENVPIENIDEVLLKLIKLSLCLQNDAEYTTHTFHPEGESRLTNHYPDSQDQLEPLVPPPQNRLS